MKIFITFYHGTTIENVKKLVQSNWDWTSKHMQNWAVSMPNTVYAWCGPAVNFLNHEENTFSKLREDSWKAIQYALESAQVAAAIQDSQYKDLVVLGYFEEIEVKSLPENYIELRELIETESFWMPDYSAENMDGAFEISTRNLYKRIPNVVYIGKETYLPILRGALIPLDNIYYSPLKLTQTEEKIINIMRKDDELSYLSLQLIDESELIEIKTFEDIEKYLTRRIKYER